MVDFKWSGILLWTIIVFLPFLIAAIVMYAKRSNLFPISARFPVLSTVGSCIGLTKIALQVSSDTFESTRPCWIPAFDLVVLSGCLAVNYLLRAYLLYQKHVAMMQKMSIQQVRYFASNRFISALGKTGKSSSAKVTPSSGAMNKQDSIARLVQAIKTSEGGGSARVPIVSDTRELLPKKKRIFGGKLASVMPTYVTRKLVKQDTTPTHSAKEDCLVAIIMVASTSIFVVLFLVSVPDPYSVGQCPRGDSLLFSGIMFGLVALCVGFAGFKMKQTYESLRIRWELVWAARVSILGLVLWVLTHSITAISNVNKKHFPISAVVILCILFCLQALTIWLPLLWSYEAEWAAKRTTQQLAEQSIGSLDQCLLDPKATKLFKAFLETEFSVENLLFYQDVETFRTEYQQLIAKGDNKKLLFKRALDLYVLYIADEAPLQVC